MYITPWDKNVGSNRKPLSFSSSIVYLIRITFISDFYDIYMYISLWLRTDSTGEKIFLATESLLHSDHLVSQWEPINTAETKEMGPELWQKKKIGLVRDFRGFYNLQVS